MERCNAPRASTFVAPNTNGVVEAENLRGDGFNVKVTRNLQAHCDAQPRLLVQLVDPGNAIFLRPCDGLLGDEPWRRGRRVKPHFWSRVT